MISNGAGRYPGANLMLVGDEVHRQGLRLLLTKFLRSISAWICLPPWSSGEEEKSIIKASGEVIKEFGIKDAIDAKVLCNYHYQLVESVLSNESLSLTKSCVIYFCLSRTTE